MKLPREVREVLDILERCGHEAWVVGGCVRDSLLGLTPHDWDICTSAHPEAVRNCFPDTPCIPTGMHHGTVTVLRGGMPLEVTTYRTESTYSDHRHPDSVSFVTSLREDLARRDFTFNAMAYHPDRGLADPFCGQQDLSSGLLRCVGKPAERFREDALRILRALRFASCYGFTVEEKTAQALTDCAPLMREVAAERLRLELDKLLTGRDAGRILAAYVTVLLPILPEIKPMIGLKQYSRYHHLDVWEHTAAAVGASMPELPVRLALLLHDCGKPFCFTQDSEGNGHFYGHVSISTEKAEVVFSRLKYDRATAQRSTELIRHHDDIIPLTEKAVSRWINRYGEDYFRQLLLVKEGDCLAHNASLVPERMKELATLRGIMEQLIAEGRCLSLKSLAINGDDVRALGIPEGKAVGEALNRMLEAVMEQRLPNDKAILLAALREKT